MKIALCLLICCSFSYAFAKEEHLLLSGTIGKSPVVMELEIDGEEISGSYYYNKVLRDIDLTGVRTGEHLSFCSGWPYEDNAGNERFRLVRKGAALKGIWMYKGKLLDVSLSKLDASKIVNNYEKTNACFAEELKSLPLTERVRTSMAVFERMDSTLVKNGVTFQWFRETHSGLEIFRVIKGLPQTAIVAINDLMECIQLLSLSEDGMCTTGGYEVRMERFFVNTDFFSVQFFNLYDCGGMHPDFYRDNYNLDLKTGKKLRTDDLLQFPGYMLETPDNFTEWLAYRREVFAKKVLEYFKIAYSDEVPEIEPEDRCNYNHPDVWAYADLLLTEEGFLAGATFPGAGRMCEDPEWSLIPYSTFKSYLNPAYAKQLLSIR